MTLDELYAALRIRFAAPEWVFLTEVRNATGFDGSRSADAVAMSVWPSRGLELHGIEVKQSRGDWLRELKQPAKAEAIARYCDRWWVAVTDSTLIADGELPAGWGLLAPRGKKLAAVVEAPRAEPAPETPRRFLASLLAAAQKQLSDGERRRIEDAARSAGIGEASRLLGNDKANVDKVCDRLRALGLRGEGTSVLAFSHDLDAAVKAALSDPEILRLRERLDAFEAAAGFTIDVGTRLAAIETWEAARLGEALALVRAGGVEAFRRRADEMRKALDRVFAPEPSEARR